LVRGQNLTDRKNKKLLFKTMIIWFTIFILASFAFGATAHDDPITIHVIPEVPKPNVPVMVTFSLNNPGSETSPTDYQLYINGQPVMSGSTILEPGAGKEYQYTYYNLLELGEQVTFLVKTQSDLGDHQKSISLPAYPPQVWSSFVSFATFSTSIMSSTSIMESTSIMGSSSAISSTSLISSMGFYEDTFGTDGPMNVGLVFSIVLIILLIYLELSEPKLFDKTYTILGNLRIRFSRLSAVLFVIFVGIVVTQIVMIIGVVS
jgi:hypothetical protein